MKKTTIVIMAIALMSLLLLTGCTKTNIQTFETKCENTGGKFSQTSNQDYSICECTPGMGYSAYAVYYKDVKNIVWSGC